MKYMIEYKIRTGGVTLDEGLQTWSRSLPRSASGSRRTD
jgi:hypothetical protein